jgi:hypothetical protein
MSPVFKTVRFDRLDPAHTARRAVSGRLLLSLRLLP